MKALVLVPLLLNSLAVAAWQAEQLSEQEDESSLLQVKAAGHFKARQHGIANSTSKLLITAPEVSAHLSTVNATTAAERPTPLSFDDVQDSTVHLGKEIDAPLLLQFLARRRVASVVAVIVAILTLLTELRSWTSCTGHGRLCASLAAAASFAASNVFAQAGMQVLHVGVLDLMYARCAAMAFFGILLIRLHPDRPAFIPKSAMQAVQMLGAAFMSSASVMLLLAGLFLAPASLVILGFAWQSGLTTLLKQCLLGETVEWEESFCSSCLIFAMLTVAALGNTLGQRQWFLGTSLGLMAGAASASCILLQRSLGGKVHHTAYVLWSGGVGLIIFSPVAVVFIEQARVLRALEEPHIPALLLQGLLSLSFMANACKAGSDSEGLYIESGYILVAGLSCCFQYTLDIAIFGDRLGAFGHSTLALVVTLIVLLYVISRRQIIQVEECIKRARRLLLEPQAFTQHQ